MLNTSIYFIPLPYCTRVGQPPVPTSIADARLSYHHGTKETQDLFLRVSIYRGKNGKNMGTKTPAKILVPAHT
jgi:hypothetical protein